MSDKEKLSSSKINSNEKITDIFKRKYDFLKDSLKNRIRLNLDIFDSNKKPIQNISIPKKQNEIKKLSFQKPEVSEKEKTIWQTIKHNNPDIEINENVLNATREAFFNDYIENPNILREAYSRMWPWEEDLKKMFKEAWVPEEFIYLAITESTADPFKVSPVKAKWPYQIMSSTAKSYCKIWKTCLTERWIIDERRDWMKSWKFCIEYLKDAYYRTSSKEKPENRWKLALSSYNWWFFWSFIKITKKEDVTLENFNQYIEDNLKALQDKARNSAVKYKVKAWDTVESIAKKYDISTEKIRKYNKIRKSLVVWQKLTLPLTSKAIFEMRAKFYRENLKYPPKLLAALDAINYLKNKEWKLEQKPKIKYDTKKIIGYTFNETKTVKKIYIVKKWETKDSIAKKFNIGSEFLAADNNLIVWQKLLRPWTKLNISINTQKPKKATFYDYYNRECNKWIGIVADSFAALNAEIDKNAIIPSSWVIIKYPKSQYGLVKKVVPEKVAYNSEKKLNTYKKENVSIVNTLLPNAEAAIVNKNKWIQNVPKTNPKETANILKWTKAQHEREVRRAKSKLHAFDNYKELDEYIKKWKLVKVKDSKYFTLNDKEIGSAVENSEIKEKYKVLLPHTYNLLLNISKEFYAIFRIPLTVNSLTRTKEYLKRMKSANKAPNSSHLYGCTFDITYKNLTVGQIRWLEKLFVWLEKSWKIEAVKESKNSTCFHIMDRNTNEFIAEKEVKKIKWKKEVKSPRKKKKN